MKCNRKFKKVGVAAALLLLTGIAARAEAATEPLWTTAEQVRFGSGVQYYLPDAQPKAISCVSAGNCTVVGTFEDPAGGIQAYTVTSTNGTWAQAVPVAFGSGVQYSIPTVSARGISCVSAGNCTTVGQFKNAAQFNEAYMATSTNGVWAPAVPVVFASGVQDTNPDSVATGVSCVSVGNCSVTGVYKPASGGAAKVFTVTSTNGTWAQAVPVVFASGVENALAQTQSAGVSCTSVGSCSVAGFVTTSTGTKEGFTVSSTNGTWAQAGLVLFGSGVQSGGTQANGISCNSPGNCTAVGYFRSVAGGTEAFMVTSTNGTWAQAVPVVFATGVHNATFNDSLTSVSCGSAGNCTAVGYFKNGAGDTEAFTVSSTNGTWAQAAPLAFGAGISNVSPDASAKSVSCASAGNCATGGYFLNSAGYYEAFVATSISGTWTQAQPVAFGAGVQYATPDAYTNAVSCSSAGNCSVTGFFSPAAYRGYETFVVSSSYAPPAEITTTVAATTTTTTVKSSTSSRPRSLPSTGSNSNSFLLVASALVIGGGFLLGPIRRRSLRKS